LVSTREQHFKDAPMPKMKNNKGEKAGEDFENKNPLWLKDKADEFFKNKDFYSAQNAYS
jgi:dyslexia susceptibility 1 candidate gene 1 protein